MKKRKSPIVLVTILIVMASVSFGLQYAWSKSGGAGQEQPQMQAADTTPVGQPRAAESKEAVAQGLKGALNSSPASHGEDDGHGHGAPGGPGGGPGGPPSGPTILNPAAMAPAAAKPEKPKPNPTATSTQWYTKDSSYSAKDKN